jgi:hypothetical protein
MPEDLVALIAPPGTDEANHGTRRWRVDNNGRVKVPREAAAHLLNTGGFSLPKQDAVLPHGFVRVRHHADPAASCGGTPLDDGAFMVPLADVAQYTAHGFFPLDDAGKMIGAPQAAAAGEKAAPAPAVDAALIQRNRDLEAELADLRAQVKAAGQKPR